MSEQTNKLVLVTGASGQQGGAVTDALLKKGFSVRALTRKADSDWANTARGRGIEVVAGDFSDQDSLLRAAQGVDTIFFMTTPFEEGVDVETEQGLAMLQAAKDSSVGHVVFSSVASANLETGIPHFESKYKVEEAIVSSGVPYTIVAPVFFHENILSPWYLPGILEGAYSAAMPGDIELQHISVKSIGEVVATIIERGEREFGKRYDLASDSRTGNEVAELLSSKLGRSINYVGFPPDAMREANEDFAIMYQWFIDTGYSVDIDALKREFPDVDWLDVPTWLSAQEIAEPASA